MISPQVLAVNLLKESPAITALVGNRIYPTVMPQSAESPAIVVYLVSNPEEELLQGATQWPVARISIECRGGGGTPVPDADRTAQAVIDWLRDKDRYVIRGTEVSVSKEGSDVTDASESYQQNGIPLVARRIVDFYFRYRDA